MRFYTRVLGLLRPDLAGSEFGLTEARVLFELAHSNGVFATDLCRELDLDAGYLSRLLGAFTTAGSVVRERWEGDGRRQIVRLTDAGRRSFADLGQVASGCDRRGADPIGRAATSGTRHIYEQYQARARRPGATRQRRHSPARAG